VGPDGSELETCCVITTQANALVKPLHNRMPVIIPNGLEEVWLEPGDQHHRHALEPMLSPIAEQGWSCRPPSAGAKGSANDGATRLIQAEQLNLL
jgi:putative SOS response-associated peptidase YedK